MNSVPFCLNPNYSTTRHLTRQQPIFEKQPSDKLESVLFLPAGAGRQGEGGLRTQGYFKTSLPDQTLITVVTVVFNGVNHLEETILSVINQTYSNIEYIIIDGGSTDGTVNIIRKYEHAIDYWVSEKDSGIYEAMNKGIVVANGEWIAILNADDSYIDMGSLSIIACLPNNIEVLATDVVMLTYEGEKLFVVDKNRPIYKNIPYMHTGMFICRSVYKQLGLYEIKYSIASDVDFIFRVIDAGIDITYHDCPLVKMRDDGASARYFNIGRKEYKEIYKFYGGSMFLAVYGYWLYIIENKLYSTLLIRHSFRLLKKAFQ